MKETKSPTDTRPPLVEMPVGGYVSDGYFAWHSHGNRQFARISWNDATKRWECSECKEPMFRA